MTTARFRRLKVAGPVPVQESSPSAAVVACTKVRTPVLRDDAIARGRLLERVRASLERYPVLLVSAPAGYGKTTLLASLPVACPDAQVAWLTADEDDNEPARFLNGLSAALSVVAPALSDLRGRGDDTIGFIDIVINELARSPQERVVLVLDELHHVREAEVLKAVTRLAERAPRTARLAIGTRHRPALPLARWKARRIVDEIGLGELAFTPEEAKEYFGFAHGLDVSDADARALTVSAEGWPAAATLLARVPVTGASWSEAALSRHRDIDALIEQEIFAALDPELRAFLMETSILPELTPSLCRDVTERADAPSLLEEAVRLNLVVPATERAPDAFRYQRLFRGFLERRLVTELPETVPALERRAAKARACDRPVRVPETGATLSPREIEVLGLVAAGASNAEIAEKLFISIHTVKRHVATLLDKLGADSRARAASAARQLGITP